MQKQYKIDYAKIRAGVPVESVLPYYNIKVKRMSDTQYKADCPLESHKAASKEHQKDTFKCGLSKKGERKFFCQSDSCRAASDLPRGGSAIDFVMKMDGCSQYEAAKKLVEWFPHLDGSNATPQPKVEPPEPPAPLPNPPLKFILTGLNPVHEALQQRGITVETAVKFNAGYFPGKGTMKDRVVFSLYEDGHLVGYAGRTVKEVADDNPKWLLPKGLNLTFLYGLERCDPAKPLMIVESCWEVLKLHQQGFQAAALLGTNLTQEQERRLQPFKTIWLMLDADEAGRKATEKLAARLKPCHTVLKGVLKDA